MSDLQPIQITERANEIAQLSSLVKAKAILDPAAKIIIDGVVQAHSWWIAADEIIFKPGAILHFPASTANVSRELYIVAERITVEDPLSPALITWEKSTGQTPPDRGQAGSGADGSGDGAPGGRGTDGAPGTTGNAGQEGPDLSLFIRTLAGGTLNIEFSGSAGGKGGRGQSGGNGGRGAQGSSARQGRKGGPFGSTIWLPYCEAGPGQGGRGGNGGTGGVGGNGGKGGRGGSVTIISIPDALPILTNALRINVAGGQGGGGGDTGQGGNPGPGGPEGALANHCNSDHRYGDPGSPGSPGNSGPNGEDGEPGRAFVASLTEAQFTALFGY